MNKRRYRWFLVGYEDGTEDAVKVDTLYTPNYLLTQSCTSIFGRGWVWINEIDEKEGLRRWDYIDRE